MLAIRTILKRALAAVRADRCVDGLEDLLTAWRATRSPLVARQIERLSIRVATDTPALVGSKPTRRQLPWLQRLAANRPEDLGRLLPFLVEGRPADSLERLSALDDVPPDPRVGSALLEIALKPPLEAHEAFWPTLFAILPKHADANTLERLTPLADEKTLAALANASPVRHSMLRSLLEETLVKSMMPGVVASLAAIEHELDAIAATAPEANPSLVAKIGAAIDRTMISLDARVAADRAAHRTTDEFLDAIANDPADLGLRQVFADWLLERQEPRGTFMALQFLSMRAPLTRKQRAQMMQPLRQHWRAWIGALTPIISKGSLAWMSGMLHACSSSYPAAAVQAAIGIREWATVARIEDARNYPRELIAHEVMRSLRVVLRTADTQAHDLLDSTGGRTLAIEKLGIADLFGRDRGQFSDRDKHLCGEAPGLPELRALELRYGPAKTIPGPTEFHWFLGTPVAHRLESLSFEARPTAIGWWLENRNDFPPQIRDVNLLVRHCRVRLLRSEDGLEDVVVDNRHEHSVVGDGIRIGPEAMPPEVLKRVDLRRGARLEGVAAEIRALVSNRPRGR